MNPSTSSENETTAMTLEAFADTIVPGEKRSPDDRVVAGAAEGPGAVAAGALELLETPAAGLAPLLGALADTLNGHAGAYAAEHGHRLDGSVPAFTGLSFAGRTELVRMLVAPGHPEKEAWVGVALFCNMAFDTAAHLHTADAMAAGHPGLRSTGFAAADADGLWRFPGYSYRRRFAATHPATTPSGSPA